MVLAVVVGIGIVCALMLFFALSWNKDEHIFLHLLTSFFVVALLVLIPKVLIDHKDNCEIVKMNETQIDNITTTFSYGEFCVTNQKNTENIFHKYYVWFIRVFALYCFMYYVYVIFIKNKDIKFIQEFANRVRGRRPKK